MGFKNIFTCLLLLFGVYGLSGAHNPQLAQRIKRNYFGDLQEPTHHSQFYLPDYVRQTEYLKHFNLPEQSSNTDLLRNFNYGGHKQQYNPAFLGELQQLNYHDMTNYPNQFHQLTHPGQIQQHVQQSGTDKFKYIQPHIPNSDDEYHLTNYRGNLNYPDQYEQHNYFNRDHQLNQQGQPEQFGHPSQLQLQPHNLAAEHQHPDYYDKLSYPNLFQHMNYSNQHQQPNQQSENKHHNELELHKSTGEPQHIDNYSNQSQKLSYSNHDQLNNEFQQHNQQNEYKHFNELELHKSTGEHQQLDNHDMPSYSSQSQQLNTSDKHQMLDQQVEHEKLGNLSQAHFHNSEGETHQINDQFQELDKPETVQLNQQGDSKDLLNSYQAKVDNSIEEQAKINYRSMHDHPIQLGELNHYSQDQNPNQQSETEQPMNLNQAQQHNFPRDQQQGNGNGAPLVQQKNEPEPSKLLNYNEQQRYPDQPVNLGHPNPNETYGYPDNLPQLNNIGLHQKRDEPSLYGGSPQLPRYTRDYEQQMYRGSIPEHLHPSDNYGYPDNLQLSDVGLPQQFHDQSVSQELLPLNEPQLPLYAGDDLQPFYRSRRPWRWINRRRRPHRGQCPPCYCPMYLQGGDRWWDD